MIQDFVRWEDSQSFQGQVPLWCWVRWLRTLLGVFISTDWQGDIYRCWEMCSTLVGMDMPLLFWVLQCRKRIFWQLPVLSVETQNWWAWRLERSMLPTGVGRGQQVCAMETQTRYGFTVKMTCQCENWTAAVEIFLRLGERYREVRKPTLEVTYLCQKVLWFLVTFSGWKLYPVRQESSCGGWGEKLMGRRLISGELLSTLNSDCSWQLITTTKYWCWTQGLGHLCRPSPHLIQGFSAGHKVVWCWDTIQKKNTSHTCNWLTPKKVQTILVKRSEKINRIFTAKGTNTKQIKVYWLEDLWIAHDFGWESFLGDLRSWSDLWAFGKSEQNWSKWNQITYRQRLPKVCLQQFHGQDEDWFGIFWALLVHFRLGIMRKEGICQIWIFGFLRSKRSNLEVRKIWGVDVEMAPYLRKYKNLVKEVYWWNVVYCMGVWVVTFDFWFLKIFTWFLGGAKVWVKKSFFW